MAGRPKGSKNRPKEEQDTPALLTSIPVDSIRETVLSQSTLIHDIFGRQIRVNDKVLCATNDNHEGPRLCLYIVTDLYPTEIRLRKPDHANHFKRISVKAKDGRSDRIVLIT